MSVNHIHNLLKTESKKIAIIGSGQLARMIALEGASMGFKFSFLCTNNDDYSAVEGLGHIVLADSDNLSAEEIYILLGKPDCITLEKEHIDIELLHSLTQFCPIYPNPDAVEVSQNRKAEKQFLQDQGLLVADWNPADNVESMMEAGVKLGWPLLIKRCYAGYDGKGQWRVNSMQEACKVLEKSTSNDSFIAEKILDFDQELSIVSARDQQGNIIHYPLMHNVHQHGILSYSRTPERSISETYTEKAQQIAETVLKQLDYVGVISIEFFLINEELVINEFAPRVHNSGHWTQSGCRTSQFLNHVRAISGLDVAPAESHNFSAMVNVLGQPIQKKHYMDKDLQVHWYNKSIKPQRKVGHINITRASVEELERKLYEVMHDYQHPAVNIRETG